MASRDFYSHTAPSEVGDEGTHSPGMTPYGTPRHAASHEAVERHTASASAGPSGQQIIRASDHKPQLSLLKQEILTEEEYVEQLSEIIKRDFFPSLRTLDAQHEILDAYESQDPARIEESVRRMREICTPTPRRRNRANTPGRTPFADSPSDTPTYFGETPSVRSTDVGATPSNLKQRRQAAAASPRIDPNISLDTFQARYTSEDNSSFAVLLARDNAARRDKHAWAWEAERRAKQKAIRGREARERLVDVTRRMVESSKDGSVRMLEGVAGRPAESRLIVEGVDGLKAGPNDRLMVDGKREGQLLITAGPARAHDSVMGPPKKRLRLIGDGGPLDSKQEQQFVDWDKPTVEEEEANKAPLKEDMQVPTETWNFTNRNSLMFPPDADIAHQSEIPGAVEPGKTGEGMLKGEPKGIRYHATRIGEMDRPGSSDASEPSPSRSRIGAAIAGTPYPAPESRTPKVQGFSFVDALPTPKASSLPAESLQELMTWGTIESTPVTLRTTESGDSAAGPFRIKDSSRRETLAHAMARKAKKSLADRAHDGREGARGLATGTPGLRRSVLDRSTRGNTPGRTGRAPAPGSASPRASSGNLSPAANALLSRTGQGRALTHGLNQSTGYSETERKRVEKARARAREVESQDKLRRQRWSQSPALSLGIDPMDKQAQKGGGPSDFEL